MARQPEGSPRRLLFSGACRSGRPRRFVASPGEQSSGLGRPIPGATVDDVASGRLSIGAHSYGVPTINAYPGDTGKVRIGKFCATAYGVEIFVGGNHRTDWVATYPFRIMFELPGALEDGAPSSKGDVVIGHDAWIGKGAKILSGVTVGNGP